MDAKVDIKPYVGEVDVIKMKQWLQQVELYLSVHEVIARQIILFRQLNLEGHALAKKNKARSKALESETLVIAWEVSKDMTKKK